MYYSFSISKLQKSKEKSLNIKSYINRIFTPESITLHENYVMLENYDLVYNITWKMWELQGYWRIQKY